jgi:hypothetical protein
MHITPPPLPAKGRLGLSSPGSDSLIYHYWLLRSNYNITLFPGVLFRLWRETRSFPEMGPIGGISCVLGWSCFPDVFTHPPSDIHDRSWHPRVFGHVVSPWHAGMLYLGWCSGIPPGFIVFSPSARYGFNVPISPRRRIFFFYL